VKLLKSKSS